MSWHLILTRTYLNLKWIVLHVRSKPVMFYKCWIFHIVKHVISMYFHMSKHFPRLLRLTYQTHLTVGICPNLETEGRMSRTNPHSHLYFSGQIPMVSLFWGKKQNKNNFRPILTPFLAILTTSIFFIFDKISRARYY